MRHILIAAAAATAFAISYSSVLAADYSFKVSLDTGPNHIRNIVVAEVTKEIEQASGGRIEFKIFAGASQFNDRDAATALAQGALDVGFPGTWNLGNILPELNAPGLPMFFGLPVDQQHKVWDGKTGQEISSRLEKKLGVVVLGPWLDLGFNTTFFSSREVKSYADIDGLKMRSPGGTSNNARLKAMGASAVSIPFPDVPQALQKGTVDGIVTTHESVRAAQLWDAGLKYSFDDYQAFNQYVPLMSKKAWDQLPQDLQAVVRKAYAAHIPAARAMAAERQKSSMLEEASHGIKNVVPSEDAREAMREKLMKDQGSLVKELRIDPKVIDLAKQDLGISQ